MSKSNLIVFTGIDGSGKTTQAKMLVESLKKSGIEALYVWTRWEPSLLRFLINKWKTSNKTENIDRLNRKVSAVRDIKGRFKSNPVFIWLWMGAFFIDYGIQIIPKIHLGLLNKRFIVSDRIYYDSVVDQAVTFGRRIDWLLDHLDSFWVRIIFPKPDMVIYVDCPGEIAFARKDDAPNLKYLNDRREIYLKLADKYQWIKMKGTLPIDEVAAVVKDIVFRKMGIRDV
jgi:thymidylate kinase